MLRTLPEPLRLMLIALVASLALLVGAASPAAAHPAHGAVVVDLDHRSIDMGDAHAYEHDASDHTHDQPCFAAEPTTLRLQIIPGWCPATIRRLTKTPSAGYERPPRA